MGARSVKTALSLLKNRQFGRFWDAVCLNAFCARRKAAHRLSCAMRLPPVRRRGNAVLYVVNRLEAESGRTIRYRVFHLIEALKGRRRASWEIIENGIDGDRRAISRYAIIVLMRLPWSSRAQQLVNSAHEMGIPVIFDIDDQIFNPLLAGDYARVLGGGKNTQASLAKTFGLFEKMLLACDFATVSTAYLKTQMDQLGVEARVIRNGFNKTQLKLSEKHRRKRKPHPDEIRIGYLSGSKTHDRDFISALPGIEQIMREDGRVALHVTGYLNPALIPEELRARAWISGFTGWKKLIKISAENDINIAPLDLHNPFCHAKSELKFYEAALLGIPTVASPTDTFTRCVEDGVNGLLAVNETEWYNAFKKLIRNAKLYSSIAKSAEKTARERYSPLVVATEADYVYTVFLTKYRGRKGLSRSMGKDGQKNAIQKRD